MGIFSKKRGVVAVPRQYEGERVVDLMVVLVDGGSASQDQWSIASVTEAAIESRGEVLQILGTMIFIGFGVIAPSSEASSLRQKFAVHLGSNMGILAKAIHGQWRCYVGNVGGPRRTAFTARPSNFGDLLRQLVALGPGEVRAVAVQPHVPPDVPASAASPLRQGRG